MTSSTPAAAIEDRLRANWTTTLVYIEDESPQPPQPPASFVLLTFPGAAATQWTIGDPGNNVWREDGSFMVHIAIPRSGDPATPGATARVARQYAESIAQIFRGQTFAISLVCYAPQPPCRPYVDGNYWNISFGVPYSFQYLN